MSRVIRRDADNIQQLDEMDHYVILLATTHTYNLM